MAGEAPFDPRLLDVALALIALEIVALAAFRMLTGHGPAARDVIPNLLAGAFLMIVAREAISGAGPLVIGASLAAALVAHGLDLATRWRRDPRSVRRQTPR